MSGEGRKESQLDRFIKKVGNAKRANDFLDTAGRLKKFKDALETPVGGEILTDLGNLIKAMDARILTSQEKISKEEWAVWRAYRELAYKWSDKVLSYYGILEKIEKA